MARTRAKWRRDTPPRTVSFAKPLPSKANKTRQQVESNESESEHSTANGEQPSTSRSEQSSGSGGYSDAEDGLDLGLIKDLQVVLKVGQKPVKVYDPRCDHCHEREKDCEWDHLSRKCIACVRAHIACRRGGVSIIELLKKAQAVGFGVTSETLAAQAVNLKTKAGKPSDNPTPGPSSERRSRRPSCPAHGDEYVYFPPSSKSKAPSTVKQESVSAPPPRRTTYGRFVSSTTASTSTSKLPETPAVSSSQSTKKAEPRGEDSDIELLPPAIPPPAPERKKRGVSDAGTSKDEAQPHIKRPKREQQQSKGEDKDDALMGASSSSHSKAEKLEALFSAYSSIDKTIDSIDTLSFVVDPNEDNAEGRDIAKMRTRLADMKKLLLAMKDKVSQESG